MANEPDARARRTYRTFRNTCDGHYKFWEYSWQSNEQDCSVISYRWGRIGTAGQARAKAYDSPAAAIRALQDQVREKLDKGYVELVSEMAQAGVDAQKSLAALGEAIAKMEGGRLDQLRAKSKQAKAEDPKPGQRAITIGDDDL